MPATLNPVIYGDKKNIDFGKYNIGSLLKAITYDLEEFGEKGVQGVPIKSSDATKMIKYQEKNKDLKQPFLMAGLCKKDLVLVIRDKNDAKFEAMSVLVKDYAGLKKKLAQQSAAVVNLQKGDNTIDNASKNQAKRKGTTSQDVDSMDIGGITGNILLCAHGTPKVKPGRVVGVKLAGKKPTEICDLITKSKDESKRIGKDYSGTITLSGCYTASGGPEKDKQDDVFAKRVWDELKKRGYKKLSVVGMPGPSWTAQDNSLKDGYGQTVKQGEKGVWAKSKRQLQAMEKKADKTRKELDKLTLSVVKAWDKFKTKGTRDEFLGNSKIKKIISKISQKEKVLESIRKEITSIRKDMDDTGDDNGRDIKSLTGTFGLRVIKTAVTS